MIKELFLKNFRGIKTGHLKDFSQINILLGPNNSGKTTIFEALYLLSCMSPGEIIHKTNYLQGVIPKKDFLGYDPLIRLQENHGIVQWENNPGQFENGLIKVSTKEKFWQISPYKEDFSYEFKPKDVNKIGYCGIDYTKKDLYTKAQTHIKEWLNLTLTEKDIETLPEKGRVSFLWFQRFVYENENIAVISAEHNESFSQVLFFDFFTAMNHMKTHFVENTLVTIPGWMDEIRDRFKHIFLKEKFQITFIPCNRNPDYMRAYIAPKKKTGISVDLLGDGARSMFKFLGYLLAIKDGGIVLWECPELFQHPGTLERSLPEIINISKKKNLQLFLNTQNLEIVALIKDMVEENVLSSEDVQGYFVDLKEGRLQYRQFTGETLGGWIEMNLDLRRKNQFEGKFIYGMGE